MNSSVLKVIVALVAVALLVIGPLRLGLHDKVTSKVAVKRKVSIYIVNDSAAVALQPGVRNTSVQSGSIAFTHLYISHSSVVHSSSMIEGFNGATTHVASNLTAHIANLNRSKGAEERWVVLSFSDALPLHPFDYSKVLAADAGENARPGKRGGQFFGKGKGSYFPALAFLNHRLYVEHIAATSKLQCSSQPEMCKTSKRDVALVQIFGVPQELYTLRSEKLLKHRRSGAIWLQPHFYKLLLLELFLPISDFLFWIDNDAFFMNWDLQLHGQLLRSLAWANGLGLHKDSANHSTSPNISESNFCMLFCRSGSPLMLNNGVGYYRGHLHGHQPTSTLAEAIVKGVWTVPTRSVGGAADNTALIAYLKTVPHRVSSCVKMVPAFLLNAYPGDTLLGQYQRLFDYEQNVTARIISGKEQVSRGFHDPDHFFRPGDWIMHAPGQRIRKSVAIRYFCFSLLWHNVTNESIQRVLAEFASTVLRRPDDSIGPSRANDDVVFIRATCDKVVLGAAPGNPLRQLPFYEPHKNDGMRKS